MCASILVQLSCILTKYVGQRPWCDCPQSWICTAPHCHRRTVIQIFSWTLRTTRVPDTEMQGISAQDQTSQHWWSPLYPHGWSALIWSQCFSPCLGNARWTQGSSGKWCYLEGVLGHVSPSHPQNCHAESAQTGLHKDPTHVKSPQHHVRDPPSPRKHWRSEKLWMLPSTPIWFRHTSGSALS